MKKQILNPELDKAWKEVLFWAKRMTYASAAKHPEWAENLAKAKAKRDEIKARLEAEKKAS